MREDARALLVLMGNKVTCWWDPFSRSWNVCRPHRRFERGYQFPSIAHDAALGRWQNVLSNLEPYVPTEYF
jgi:hypothetical protein